MAVIQFKPQFLCLLSEIEELNMKTFIKVLSIVALAAAATGAQAQLYGEVGYAPLKFSGSDAGNTMTASPKVIGLTLGYDLYKNVAVEGIYAFSAGDDTATLNGAATVAKLKVESAYGLFVKPKTMLGVNFEVFGRLGYIYKKVNVSGPGVSDSADGNGFAYGLGANYYFAPKTYVTVNYTNYYNKDDGKVDGFMFGVGMKF